jgi:hypothetical protein
MPPLTTPVVGVVEVGGVVTGVVGVVVPGVVFVGGVVAGLVVEERPQPVIRKAITSNTITGINIFFIVLSSPVCSILIKGRLFCSFYSGNDPRL